MRNTLRIGLCNPGLVTKVSALVMLAMFGALNTAQALPVATTSSTAFVPLLPTQSGTNTSTTGPVSSYTSISNLGNDAYGSVSGAANDSFFAARSGVTGTGTASTSYLRTFSIDNNSGEARLYRLDSLITQGGLVIDQDLTQASDARTTFQWKVTSNGVQVALAGGDLRTVNRTTTVYTGFGDVSLSNQSTNVGGSNGYVSWGSTAVSRDLGLIGANSSINVTVELLTYTEAFFSSTPYNCGGYGYGYGYGDQIVEGGGSRTCYRPGGYAFTRFGDPSSGEFSTFTVSSEPASSNVPLPASALLLALGLGGIGFGRFRTASKKPHSHQFKA